MTAPRLIRLVPTGVCHEGIEFVEPEEVQPLSEEQAFALVEADYRMEEYADAAIKLIRAVEQAHGIGRRMDA